MNYYYKYNLILFKSIIYSDGKPEYESCTMKNLDYSVLSTKSFEEVVASMSPAVAKDNESIAQCNSRDFDPTFDTIVTKVIIIFHELFYMK